MVPPRLIVLGRLLAQAAPRLRTARRVLADYADRAGPPITLGLLILYFALSTKHFWELGNFVNIGTQSAAVGIVAVGETLVIISGGIDLSVGSVVVLSGVAAAVAARDGAPLWMALLLGVTVGALAGAFSGLITALARMPSFVVTLGMMMVCRGAALVLAESKTVMPPGSFGDLGAPLKLPLSGHLVMNVPPILVVLAVVAVLMGILLRYTTVGRYAYALGGNMEAARLSGVPVAAYQVVIFAICGLLSGLAGVLLATRLGVASPSGAPEYELQAIAATVIGGASLMGGRGGVGGTFVGFLIMGVLLNGLNLQGRQPPWQKIAVGATIIIAVFADHLRRRRRAG